ncbi:MAG: anhydro-N-acetylmuramic acid kinase [Candidatus Handelsmanbacteria bacterium]|nr:anhydro-N-acetylmuramic acid kinase [Candidatus Handelsmanbacteria bacterium]
MERLLHLSAKKSRRIAGLMSGTSADGIDAALVEVEGAGRGTRVKLLAFQTLPLEGELRQGVFSLFGEEGSLDELCRLNFALGAAFAEAALAVIAGAGLRPEEVDLIGSHGQTVRHLPQGRPASTLQIGEPAVIAQRTGIPTIADFRPADMALGGQGAPLVPLVDFLLFNHGLRGRALLNIGGIANATILPAGGEAAQVWAFDLGPGNALIDGAASHFSGGKERCDRDGRGAAAGQVDEGLLAGLLAHPFLHLPPPKSTGREEFGAGLLAEWITRHQRSPADWLATLTAFTARAIAGGLERFALSRTPVDEVWVSGGGAHNPVLMAMLQEALPGLKVGRLDELGLSVDAKEAVAFAVLANETLMGRPGNLPSATGARRPAVLGKICLV